jgi:probable phosphoglycerate mutase
MDRVLLVRHGETTWNRSGRIQGWAPTPLTERGRAQAEALAAHVATVDPDRVVASDLRRARETAEYVARATGLEYRVDAAWRERDFGFLQGLKKSTLREEHPEYVIGRSGAAAASRRPEGGESVLDVRDRVIDGWERLVGDLDGETAVVVAHSGSIRLVRGHLEGLDVAEAMARDKDNCAVTEVAADGDGARIVRDNDAAFLDETDSGTTGGTDGRTREAAGDGSPTRVDHSEDSSAR